MGVPCPGAVHARLLDKAELAACFQPLTGYRPPPLAAVEGEFLAQTRDRVPHLGKHAIDLAAPGEQVVVVVGGEDPAWSQDASDLVEGSGGLHPLQRLRACDDVSTLVR